MSHSATPTESPEEDPRPLKIVALRASNVKRLEAVEIHPDGALVVVSGENGSGKSSTLDSIAYCLGGKDLICDEPLRRGARKAQIDVDLGDYRVERTFTAGGAGRLRVFPQGGAPMRAPQTFLDELMGKISFDPLAFSRMRAKDQRETLAALVGLDTRELDQERQKVFDIRTGHNREMARLKGVLSEVERHEDVPEKAIEVGPLLADLEAADRAWETISEYERRAQGIDSDQKAAVLARKTAERRIEELKLEIETLGEIHNSAAQQSAALMASHGEVLRHLDKLPRPDRAPIRDRIAQSEEINEKVRVNERFVELSHEISREKAQWDHLTARIEEIDAEKRQRIEDATYPIEGLAVDDDGVIFRELPLSQASSAEQLRVSVAIGLAMNPRLRVLLIRDGSLLDTRSLALVGEMAAEADSQVWMERVEEDEATSVVIEDGRVRAESNTQSQEDANADAS